MLGDDCCRLVMGLNAYFLKISMLQRSMEHWFSGLHGTALDISTGRLRYMGLANNGIKDYQCSNFP